MGDSGGRGLRLLEEPIPGYEILKHYDVPPALEHDIEVSSADGIPPPFVIDTPRIDDDIDDHTFCTAARAARIRDRLQATRGVQLDIDTSGFV